jgi:hypothetical protein
MSRLAVLLAAAVIALPAAAIPAAAAERWRIGPAPSDHADLKAATVSNADGYTVYLWALDGDTADQVFCELHLAAGQAFGDAMPVYQIDDRAAVDTAEIRDAGDAQRALWAHVGENAAFWLISILPASDAAPDAALRPWMDGSELVVSFEDIAGAPRTARFTLAGSAEAIRGATGITRD